MSKATRTICDQCQGVIPDGAPYVSGVSATLVLTTGSQAYQNLDFCCTAHMSAYIGSQPQVADPATSYPVIPT